MLTSSSLEERLTKLGVAKPQEIIGCTDDEIDHLKRRTKLPLSKAHEEFLKVAGKKAGRFMSDVDIFYNEIASLNQKASDKLDLWEEGRLKLPQDALVFAMRRGEQFMFYIADGKQEDPEIYDYYEGAGQFKLVANSLWDVIEGEILDLERFRRNHPDAPYWNISNAG
jgi:hypothetical protein